MNVQLLVDVLHGATVVPTSAIQRGVSGTFVYLINSDDTVTARPIKLGPSSGDRVAVSSGLSPGDRVVIDGADKLSNGAKVVLHDSSSASALNPANAGAASKAQRPQRSPIMADADFNNEYGRALSPSSLFILRPVATSLLMIAILLSGILAFQFLPLAALPEVDYPTIQVQTFYPGASPDVMTSSVTAPLEVQLGQMPSFNQMTSVSSAGASVITLQFGLNLSLDIPNRRRKQQSMPPATSCRLTYRLRRSTRRSPWRTPVRTLALTSKTSPLPQVEDLADAPRTADFADLRRGSGQHQRRPATGSARPGGHPQACSLRS